MTETTFLVLLSLFSPRHGYGIMQFILEATGGRVHLGAGTLYGALNALLKKQWIEPLDSPKGKGKKRYMLTTLGEEAARQELSRLKSVRALAESILGGGDANAKDHL